jgi:hypothetical protein
MDDSLVDPLFTSSYSETPKNTESKESSSNVATYLAITALVLVFIVMVIAIVALFFPKASNGGIYTQVQTVTVPSGTVSNNNFSTVVNLPNNNVANTLFNLVGNGTAPLAPVVVTANNFPTNVNFTLFSTVNTNPIFVYFSGFNNISTNDVISLDMAHNSMSVYIDNNRNIYYQYTSMFPYVYNSVMYYNNNSTPATTFTSSSSTPASPLAGYLHAKPAGGNANIRVIDNKSNIVVINNGNNPAYLYLATDGLVSNMNGYNYIFNSSSNVLNYAYGLLANQPTTAVGYSYSIQPNSTGVILYNNGSVVFPN